MLFQLLVTYCLSLYLLATATKVPAVSKKSIKKNVKITIRNWMVNNWPGSLNASKAAPNVGVILEFYLQYLMVYEFDL